jgi:hypothetical protein
MDPLDDVFGLPADWTSFVFRGWFRSPGTACFRHLKEDGYTYFEGWVTDASRPLNSTRPGSTSSGPDPGSGHFSRRRRKEMKAPECAARARLAGTDIP